MVAVLKFSLNLPRVKTSFDPRKARVFFRWSTILLLAFLASYQILQLKVLLSSPLSSVEESHSVLADTEPRTAQNITAERVNPEEIVSWSLFGRVAEQSHETTAAIPVPEEPKVAVPTKLNLDLEGVVFANQSGGSKAIIVHNGKRDQYGEGDSLPVPGGVKVTSVQVDRVVLDNNGTLEALLLYSDSESSIDNREELSIPGRNDLREGLDQKPKEVAEKRGKYLADVLSFSMSRENGKLQGFKVSPLQNGTDYAGLGFIHGDIVVGINDIMLDTPKKAIELFKIIRANSKASFLVLREKKQLVVDVAIDENT